MFQVSVVTGFPSDQMVHANVHHHHLTSVRPVGAVGGASEGHAFTLKQDESHLLTPQKAHFLSGESLPAPG